MRARPNFNLLICLLTLGCNPDGLTPASEVARVTLENGATLVRYPHLPNPTAPPIEADLVLGASDDPELIFGDVRSIDARSDGSIYVLDFQASEVRVFDAEGRYQGVVVSRGEGPGEITKANGMTFASDSILWIQDHGKWRMLAVRPDGEEVTRHPMHVLEYGYAWEGTVDNRGRFWKTTTHSDVLRPFPPEVGLTEGTTRLYMKSFDPASDQADSIFLSEVAYRSFVQQQGAGYSHWRVPFDPTPITIANQNGDVWHTIGSDYRVMRLGGSGDTLVTLEVALDPLPVTAEDRRRFVEEQGERGPAARTAAERVADLMRSTKPAITGLLADDAGRLWVRRATPDGERPIYDVFTGDGDHIRSVTLAFHPTPFIPIRVRRGHIYAVVRDSMDVPTVVRAPVPPL